MKMLGKLGIIFWMVLAVISVVGAGKLIPLPTTEIPTVYAQWGGKNCVRAELHGQKISCKQALAGRYEVVYVPHDFKERR